MKLIDAIILCILGLMVVLALATCPYEDLASFDPVGWLADAISGFFNLIYETFFGWLTKT